MEFLERIVLDNRIADYLWALGLILFVLLLNRYISKYIATAVCRLFQKKWKDFDDQKFVELIIHPLGWFLVISVTIVSLYRLHFPGQLNISIHRFRLQGVLMTLSTIVHVTAFIWLALRVVDFVSTIMERRANLTPSQTDNQLVVFFRDFLKVLIGFAGVLMVLHFAFDYNIGSLLTGLSIVGAAVALALRESLENLIASFVIFLDKPFSTGDFVKVQGVSGTVERIGLRSTRLRAPDKSYITVPNKQMVDSINENVSLRTQVRGEVSLNLHLQTPPEKLQLLLAEVRAFLENNDKVMTHNELFTEIRLQSFLVSIEYFTPNMEGAVLNSLKQELNFHILQTLDKLNIRIAAEGKDLAILP